VKFAAATRRTLPNLPLFGQVLAIVLLSLVAALAVNLFIVFRLPPPTPDVYRQSEISQALRGTPFPTHEGGPPLVVARADAPPRAPPRRPPRSVRELVQALARDLQVRPEDIVIATERQPFGFDRHLAMRQARERFQRSGGSPDEHILLAPFKVGLRQPDGHWMVAEPKASWRLNPWQRRILLWFALSAVALAPVAYVFARRLAEPIAAFARAAERLGRDPGAPPLELSGPAEIRQAVSAFNGMQDRLRRYIEDRTTMIGAIAHDLRTPLTRLRFRVEGVPEPLRSKMAADMDQMEAMMAATLAFVRDATHSVPHRKLELRSLVECVAHDMSDTGIDVAVEPGPPVQIEGDPVSLRRLVANLLDNAVKFAGSARARVYAEDGSAAIEVDDTGPGLPPTDLEAVFEPFRRGEPSRSRDTGGAGLGLAVVRSIARAHGGDAALENRPEGGLRAKVHLPLGA
jgi:signal transduction histidine kinase